MFDWNDLRFFLAVARDGNTLAASRTLRVSQTTVARRIEAMEAALGVELFDKRRTGYVPTEAAQELLVRAGEAEAAIEAFEAGAHQRRRTLSGTVRVTTNELFAQQLLTPIFKKMRSHYPDIRLEMITDDRYLDLAKGEADIAMRGTMAPRDAGLVGRRLTVDTWSVYCSREYASAQGAPATAGELARHPVISLEANRYGPAIARWIDDNVPDSSIVMRRSSISGLFNDIKNGLGVSVMSDMLAMGDADFVRCFVPDVEWDREVWLMTHERLRNVPRIRAVLDFMQAELLVHPGFRGK